MGEAGRHRRNAMWLAAGDLATKLLGVVYFLYMSRELTGPELATFALFLALFPIASVIMSLGLPDVITRELSRENLIRQPRLLRRAFGLQCVCAAALGICVLPVLRWGSADAALAVSAAWAAGFIWAGIALQNAVFAAHEDFRPVSAVNATVRIALTLGSITLLYAGFRLRALFGLMIPLYALQLFFLFMLQRRLVRTPAADPAPVSRRYLVREGVAMLGGRLAATGFYRTGMPVLHGLAMPGIAELYGQGFRFWVLLTTLPDTLESLFLPVMSRRAKQDAPSQHFALLRFLKYMATVGIPAAAGTTLLAMPLTMALFGPGWEGSAAPLVALTWVMAFTMADRPAVVYLRAQGRQSLLVRCYGAGVAAKIAMAWFLTPVYGLTGLLAIEVGLSLILTTAIWIAARAVLPMLRMRDIAGVLWKPALASLVMAGALWPIQGWAIGWTVPAGAAVYGVAILLLRGVDSFDWAMIRGRGAAPTA